MKNILIVDDDVSMQNLLVHYLRKAGYFVMVTSSAEEALAKKFPVLPDLIILDKIMAGLDGFDLVRRLKKKKPSAYRRVIMLTACSEPLDSLEGLKAGADDYIVKPFKPKILLARVKAQLRIKDTIDDLRDEVKDLAKQLVQQSKTGARGLDSHNQQFDPIYNDKKDDNVDVLLRQLDLNIEADEVPDHKTDKMGKWPDSVAKEGIRQIGVVFSKKKRSWTRRYKLYLVIFGISILISTLILFIEKKILPFFRQELHRQGQFYEPKDSTRHDINKKSLKNSKDN